MSPASLPNHLPSAPLATSQVHIHIPSRRWWIWWNDGVIERWKDQEGSPPACPPDLPANWTSQKSRQQLHSIQLPKAHLGLPWLVTLASGICVRGSFLGMLISRFLLARLVLGAHVWRIERALFSNSCRMLGDIESRFASNRIMLFDLDEWAWSDHLF